jgi:predicted transcriptional regulator
MMTITIDLPDEVHERLEKQAQLRGTTVSEAIAQLIEEIEAAYLSAVVRQMQEEGLFADPPAAPPAMPPDFQPIRVQGPPLSETILAERR